MRGLVLCALFAAAVSAAPGLAHPLDALSPDEIDATVAALRQAGDADDATRFALIDLDEPDKPAVLAWRPGEPFARKAFVTARRDRTVYEGVVNLASRKVERWEKIPGVQSGIL